MSLLNKIGTSAIRAFLPMRNKSLLLPCKVRALGCEELLESLFRLLLVVQVFSLRKVVEMLEEVVVSWREVRWIRQMRQSFVEHFVQLLKHWSCTVRLGTVVEKNRAPSLDRCRLQPRQFSVHLVDLLSTVLRCNGFTRTQQAVVDQTRSRPPNSGCGIFGVQVWFWEVFGVSSRFSHRAGHCPLYKITCHNLRNGPLLWEEKTTLQNDDFFFTFGQLMRHSLIELFHLSNLLQNDWRMVNFEFLGNFSCSFKRISLDDPLNWLLSAADGQSLSPHPQGSRLLCKTSWTTAAPFGSWAKCSVDAVSCLHYFETHFELE